MHDNTLTTPTILYGAQKTRFCPVAKLYSCLGIPIFETPCSEARANPGVAPGSGHEVCLGSRSEPRADPAPALGYEGQS